jgi:hypothetical protein
MVVVTQTLPCRLLDAVRNQTATNLPGGWPGPSSTGRLFFRQPALVGRHVRDVMFADLALTPGQGGQQKAARLWEHAGRRMLQ